MQFLCNYLGSGQPGETSSIPVTESVEGFDIALILYLRGHIILEKNKV